MPTGHANEKIGVYFLPDCERYNKLNGKVLLELPTAQEAELSGYRIASCSKKSRGSRLAKEREIYGELEPTSETKIRKAQLLAQRRINELEMK